MMITHKLQGHKFCLLYHRKPSRHLIVTTTFRQSCLSSEAITSLDVHSSLSAVLLVIEQ